MAHGALDDSLVGCEAELQRRSSKILPGQRPLSKRFLSSDGRFSPPPQGNIPPIKTKCLMYVNADL